MKDTPGGYMGYIKKHDFWISIMPLYSGVHLSTIMNKFSAYITKELGYHINM